MRTAGRADVTSGPGGPETGGERSAEPDRANGEGPPAITMQAITVGETPN